MIAETLIELSPLDSLEFVVLKIPRLIPKHLIDAVKGKTFTTERFYDYQESQVKNPNNFLYALIDDKKKIHGFLWFIVDALDDSIYVNTFSIEKNYWGIGKETKKKAMKKVIDFMQGVKNRLSCTRVTFCTLNPNWFKINGFKQSKHVLMTYEC